MDVITVVSGREDVERMIDSQPSVTEGCGVVYGIGFSSGLSKIGFTKDITRRVKTIASVIRNYNDREHLIEFLVFTKSHANYKENEAIVHKRFASCRRNGEFFSVSLGDLVGEFGNLCFKTNKDVGDTSPLGIEMMMYNVDNIGGHDSLVFQKDGKIITTSLKVAEFFGKEHKNILRDIRNINKSTRKISECFLENCYIDARGAKRPCFEITRDGIVLLAMGFTGGKSMIFKEEYISRFNAMEEALMQINYRNISSISN